MDISIIIAHFDPGDSPACVESFHKVLNDISEQRENLDIEILIADDGSLSHSEISRMDTSKIKSNGREIHCLSATPLKKWLKKNNCSDKLISHWLYLPKDTHNMCKARLGNMAAELAQGEILIFLDDDNYFVSTHSLKNIKDLMEEYAVVFGQVESKNGRRRDFNSHRVQGTSFAIDQKLFKDIGGFGVWTERISCGIDSDFWWKLHQYTQRKKTFQVAYSSALQTVDSCSKRWKPYVGHFFRHYVVKKQFYKQYGCKDYRSFKHNPSRDKTCWMVNLT